jgi:predicted nucleic acid-binding Zn ribbon protein
MARWPQVVGADLADHVVPESFTDGQLILRADSTAWATQVRLLLPQLRTEIDREVGRGLVADISVVGPQAPSWVAGPRRVAGRGPRDTYG